MVWTPSGFVTAGGKRLEIACFGPPPGVAPTIILLHEGLGCVALWRDFPQKLADATGLGVLAYSRAGYGQSDPTDLPRSLNYMTDEAVDVLPEVLDQVGIRDAVLFGHSDGGTIASIYAGHYDDPRIKGLIAMAPHFFTEDAGLAEIAAIQEAYHETDLPQKVAKYHRDPDNAFLGWSMAWTNPDFRKWNVTAFLDEVTVPVLAIQGEADQYGTLAQIKAVQTRCKGKVEHLILPGVRHAPQFEAQAQVLEAVRGFCTDRRLFNHA